MRTLKFINSKGIEIILSNSAPFILQKFDVQNNIEVYNSKGMNQDGNTYIGNTLDVKVMNIQVAILAKNKLDMSNKREEINKAFNPKTGEGSLIYEDGHKTRTIRCILTEIPFFKVKTPFHEICLLPLIANDSFWLDEFETSKEISTWIGGMRFPLKLPTKFATKGEGMINIINDGDVETPLKIEIWGPSTNPRITNRLTNEYIQINRKVLQGERLVITTEFGNKRVELNGENVFNYIDLGSTFFNLQVGDNVLEQTSSNVNDDAKVRISYYNRYLGI